MAIVADPTPQAAPGRPAAKRSGSLAILPAAAVDDPRLGHAAFRTLAAIACHADRDGWAWPSQRHLAARLGLARQSVARSIGQLERLGYLQVQHRRHDDGAKRSSLYRVVTPMQHDAASMQHDAASMQHAAAGGQHRAAGVAASALHPMQRDAARGGSVTLQHERSQIERFQMNDHRERSRPPSPPARGGESVGDPADPDDAGDLPWLAEPPRRVPQPDDWRLPQRRAALAQFAAAWPGRMPKDIAPVRVVFYQEINNERDFNALLTGLGAWKASGGLEGGRGGRGMPAAEFLKRRLWLDPPPDRETP